MTDILIPFVLVVLCGLFQYGSLIMVGKEKKITWKRGILTGMTASGLAAFGFVSPELNPWPWHTFGAGTAFMLGSVLYSYYYAYPYPIAMALLQERRHTMVREMGIAIVFLVFVTVIVAFMQGQQQGTIDEASFSSKLDTMLTNQEAMKQQMNSAAVRLRNLESQVAIAAHKDSVARFQKPRKSGKKSRPFRAEAITSTRKEAESAAVDTDTVPVRDNPWWQFWKWKLSK